MKSTDKRHDANIRICLAGTECSGISAMRLCSELRRGLKLARHVRDGRSHLCYSKRIGSAVSLIVQYGDVRLHVKPNRAGLADGYNMTIEEAERTLTALSIQ